MGVAVCLRFDSGTMQAVERIWQRIDSDMVRLGYPPHLTLLMTKDDAAGRSLGAHLETFARGAPGRLRLSEPLTFPQSEVVYLGVEGDLAPLHELQRRVAGLVTAGSIDEHYRPSAWVPHVTLQMTGDGARSLAMATEVWQPMEAAPVSLDLVTFPPVAVVASVAIPATA